MRKDASGSVSALPGEPGIWLMVGADLIVFGIFFLTVAFYSATEPSVFRSAKAAMALAPGLMNTLLLLTSSWCVAMAVANCRNLNRRTISPRFTLLAMLCGLAFIVVKVFEYRSKVQQGITLESDDFYMLYFMFTGIHLIHVFAGMLALSLIFNRSRKENFDCHDLVIVESCATFWHLVDLLWVILFALFYVGP